MKFFQRSLGRGRFQTTPSEFLTRTVIASSATATCLYNYYVFKNDDEIIDPLKDGNNGGGNSVGTGLFTGIGNLSEAASSMTTTTTTTTVPMTTDCLAMSNLKDFFGRTKTLERKVLDDDDKPHLLFLGTGSSIGCPKPICAMNRKEIREKAQHGQSSFVKKPPDPASCNISHLALEGGDPKSNRNYRNNPCLLIHHYDEDSKNYKNIIIDVGKTFRETALRWFPIHGVESLDAIILTHHHMDAAAGLDDVRGFQGRKKTADGGTVRQSIPLFLSDFCHLNLQSQFPWLLPKTSGPSLMPQQAKDRPTVKRDVASFDVTIFQDYKEEIIGGFRFVPLPVWHGDDLISHGFAFSLHPGPSSSSSSSTAARRPLNVVYLSDISRMVPETLEYIKKKLPPTDILVLDSLAWDKVHPVHFSMEQAVELSKVLRPRIRTYLIGMSCDNFLPHDEMNAYLRETYGKGDDDKEEGVIAMAHDGLVVELPKHDSNKDE